MHMHVKVCLSFTHKHVGRLVRTKLWMTTHCWDEEEAWQHEECLGGIRRHFWFGMVSSMYVMSVSALKEKITCKAAAAHHSRVCALFLQTQEVLKTSIWNKNPVFLLVPMYLAFVPDCSVMISECRLQCTSSTENENVQHAWATNCWEWQKNTPDCRKRLLFFRLASLRFSSLAPQLVKLNLMWLTLQLSSRALWLRSKPWEAYLHTNTPV